MPILREIAAVTRMNFQNVPQRPGSSLVVVIGIAGVVAVLLSILSMVTGLSGLMTSSARPDRAIVIGTGASVEILSSVSREAAQAVMNVPGIKRTPQGDPMASPEAVVIVRVPLKADGTAANISLRGVAAAAFDMRPELHIVEGRMFEPGVRELIVGRSAQRQFVGLEPGRKVTLRGAQWDVVGVFESGGDHHEAELLTGSETLLSAFRRNTFQSVAVQLESAEAFARFKGALSANPALSVDVLRETEYEQKQSSAFTRVISVVAYLIGGIMAVGAVFGALNAMYTAVSTRMVEIATLRVLGFGATAVVLSVFAEALLLAALGGIAGAGIAWLIFDGHIVSTSGAGASLLAVPLAVGGGDILLGISLACAIGLVGASFPAIRAARAPLAAALRGT